VWDLLASTGRRGTARDTGAKDLGPAWEALAGLDAEKAYRAIGQLAAAPVKAVGLLRARVKPAAAPNGRRLHQLVADLDSGNFAVREKAARELAGIGAAVEPYLLEVLASKPSAEVRKRIEEILRELEQRPLRLTPEQLQALRAVQVLEQIESAEAWRLLRDLGEGWPEARLTQEARSALRRLGRRPSS
ncbi:MAG TPA: hypothetical protein VKD72_08720, partial [Gemmataceae bacterium]|nr:hypothetical protein [Gemmataceae bacterium]